MLSTGQGGAGRLFLTTESSCPFTVQTGSIVGLLASLEAHNHDLRRHSEKVCILSEPVAVRMGIRGKRLVYLRFSALLHDVGKLGVPSRILDKPGLLSLEEALFVQDHSLRGEQVLRALSLPDPICHAVRSHHERFDGKGYPDGLAGLQIPLEARILQVADAYDAVTEHRPYRAAMSPEDACRWISGLSGTAFDPDVVEAFLGARAC